MSNSELLIWGLFWLSISSVGIVIFRWRNLPPAQYIPLTVVWVTGLVLLVLGLGRTVSWPVTILVMVIVGFIVVIELLLTPHHRWPLHRNHR